MNYCKALIQAVLLSVITLLNLGNFLNPFDVTLSNQSNYDIRFFTVSCICLKK